MRGSTMYGLPDDFDYGIFAGRALRVVSYAEYSMYLHFDRDCTISIEGTIAIDDSDPVEVSQHPTSVIFLIGATVSSARRESLGTMCLQFETDHIIRIFDSFAMYESYSISADGKTTIV